MNFLGQPVAPPLPIAIPKAKDSSSAARHLPSHVDPEFTVRIVSPYNFCYFYLKFGFSVVLIYSVIRFWLKRQANNKAISVKEFKRMLL